METLGERVKRLREARKLSQAELADAVSTPRSRVKQQNIQQLESGEVRAPKYLVQLARYFDKDPVSLLNGDDDAPSATDLTVAPKGRRRHNLEDRMIDIEELDVDLTGGTGGSMHPSDSLQYDHERVVARWRLPSTLIRAHTSAAADGLKIVRVVGDSNIPEYMPGDRVLVNTVDRLPSPSGMFAIWDGFAEIFKRIEIVPYSDPPMLELSSINPAYPMRKYRLDEVTINGRVIGKWDWKG